VENKGPVDATGVTVKDILPSDLSYMSSTGAYIPGSGLWIIGNIAADSIATILITAKVTSISAPITNFAQVETATPNDSDSTPGNNTDNIPNEDDEDEVTIQPRAQNVNTTQANTGLKISGDAVLHFNAYKDQRMVALQWMSNTEPTNDYFIVELSTDGIHFEGILEVFSKSDEEGFTYYNDVDDYPAKDVNYYRL
ncbi:MAG: DUF11 domain-containing protein, partial [Bacteroidetes bacterium]|nr:DUF11 domain-containing protein [Bacteroidota bacterium]